MRHLLRVALGIAVLGVLGTGTAWACHVEGTVRCYPEGLPLGGITVNVFEAGTGNVIATSTTADDGTYYVLIKPDGTIPPGLFVTLDLPSGASFVNPAGPVALTTENTFLDWAVDAPELCGNLGCWLTAGGAKINPLTNITLAEKGPKINFGGNVNPGCSPTAGDGGNWNHLDKTFNYHFQMSAIQVLRCGNVDGIPPGSTSPVTPYNFIEWKGQGRAVKPINADITKGSPVCFYARAEDRNEPGSNGARDGALKDRYYIGVFECDGSGLPDLTKAPLYYLSLIDPGTGLLTPPDASGFAPPIPITDGNLQLHVSSCP